MLTTVALLASPALADDVCHADRQLLVSVSGRPSKIIVGLDQAVLAPVFQVEQSRACSQQCTVEWRGATRYHHGAAEPFDLVDVGGGRAALWPLPPAGVYLARVSRICPEGHWSGRPDIGPGLSGLSYGRALLRWGGQ